MPKPPDPLCVTPPGPRPFLAPLFGRRQAWTYRLLVGVWAAAALFFWVWWLSPGHVLGPLRFALLTAALAWLTLLQVYFLYFMLRARRPVGDLAGLGGARVAMIVTKSPSEPFDVVRRTLEGMLAQDWPHDTWLADEDPAPETLAWCAAHGVQVSTRKGRADYHRAEWPRRTRCKEGNLAFFYDHYGYDRYDFVSQLDADHVPQPGYLREMLRPFLDPRVGYVSAPSICASNAAESWAARMRLHHEGMFHGVLQAGYANGWAPMCIGSHYAVRTAALREVGGLGPELAEDHSTSMILNAGGWRGVHAIDAFAIGDGPVTFADMLTQEFQWSRSLMTLLLRHTRRYIGRLPLRLKLQFLFCQTWYPFFAVFMLMSMLIPAAAVVFDMRFANVTWPGFIAHSTPSLLVFIAIIYRLRADRVSRPLDARVLSWEKALFPCAQWPWVLWGCVMAVRDSVTGRFVDYRITPKGAAASAALPWRVLTPYLVLCTLSVLPVLLFSDVMQSPGFYLLCLFNGVVYLLVMAVAILGAPGGLRPGIATMARRAPQLAAALCMAALIAGSGWMRGLESLHYLTMGLGPLQFTREQFLISGAGQGGGRKMHYSFDFDLNRVLTDLHL